MDDETYFGNGLPNYISNSLMGLINPDQGGSARKFFYGFEDEAKRHRGDEYLTAVSHPKAPAQSRNLSLPPCADGPWPPHPTARPRTCV